MLNDEPGICAHEFVDSEADATDVIVSADDGIDATIQSGTRIVILDDASTIDEILAAVCAGSRPPSVETSPVDERTSPAPAPMTTLTPREAEILHCIAAGLPASEVSEHLGISRKTVEGHKRRIFTKLGVQNQAHAVAIATRAGMLEGRG
ncbi:MAG TPA: response regulator transcription factor [Acidimicrobiales bacterium]|nr:response regulator transcription factor [Acidimicrobiales bacterium]